MRDRSRLWAVACVALACAPATARAQGTPAAPAPESDAAPLVSAPALEKNRHTQVELSTGFLMLPGALVCPQTVDPATCKRGEFSLVFGLQNFYRFGATRFGSFGIGAGIQWATTLRSDAAQGDPSLEREHSRSYFLFEAAGRWYFISNKSWVAWTGVTVGGIIVNDSWSEKADRQPYTDTAFVGPRAATLGTEGLTLGASIGGEWTFAKNWSLGPSLRYSSWFLPDTRKMSPTGDVASLSGRLDMIDVGIRVAYRIAL